MANTGSFTVVRDNHDKPLDMFSVSTPQPILKEIVHKDSRLGKFQAPRSDIQELIDFEDADMAIINLCFKAQKLSSGPSVFKILCKKRKEATATDKRNYARQFERERKNTNLGLVTFFSTWLISDDCLNMSAET